MREAAIVTESKKREVLQLLKEYQTWHVAFGGARAWDEQHIATAGYGPAGLIEKGAAYLEYTKDEVRRLATSYDFLDTALDLLKMDGPLGLNAWFVLHGAYLRDEADPSVVDKWRETKPNTAEWHDMGVAQLAFFLRRRKLYPIEPKHLSESEDKSIENQNAQMYVDFQRERVSGKSVDKAVRKVAKEHDVLADYVYRIIEFRSTLKAATCVEVGCDRAIHSQNLCSRHYQQHLKRQKGKAS